MSQKYKIKRLITSIRFFSNQNINVTVSSTLKSKITLCLFCLYIDKIYHYFSFIPVNIYLNLHKCWPFSLIIILSCISDLSFFLRHHSEFFFAKFSSCGFTKNTFILPSTFAVYRILTRHLFPFSTLKISPLPSGLLHSWSEISH